MIFNLPCCDSNYEEGKKSGTINGGTVWLDHIAHALRWHGHEARLVPLSSDYQGDYIIIQSEWIAMPDVRTFKGKGGKVITLCGHFISHVYPRIETVHELSDHMITMWEGELTQVYPRAFFMPHAYSDLTDDQNSATRIGDIVWAGNTYHLRDEGWLSGLPITQIRGTLPNELFALYRGANVCPGLHGDFQKNIVSDHPSKIADLPGMMVNERFWNVLGCGGVLVTDWVPQMERWFSKDELIVGETKEDYQEKIKHYNQDRQGGRDFLEKAREKVRNGHTYRHRVRDLLKHLNLSHKECD